MGASSGDRTGDRADAGGGADAATELERLLSEDRGRLLAGLIARLGDFDVAEEALQEASARALVAWTRDGPPRNGRAWLMATARNAALDRLRRRSRWQRRSDELLAMASDAEIVAAVDALEEEPIGDERLRLIFTCCHPALPKEASVALTLRTLCGLNSDEIARAFLVPRATVQQRIVRAKRKIRDAGIPYRVPPPELLAERLDSVLRAVYLVFNEGYAATAGPAAMRADLSAEAIRLGRMLVALLPGRSEVIGLLALMLLQDCRRPARFDDHGDLVRLPDQDRSLWLTTPRREGLVLVEEALRAAGRPGFYALQAAIAAVHARADSAADTDWREIVGLYDLLLAADASPVAALNRAVAVGELRGPEVALDLVAALAGDPRLEGYHLLPAVRGELLERAGRPEEAVEQLRRARALCTNEAEQRFLDRRLRELDAGSNPPVRR